MIVRWRAKYLLRRLGQEPTPEANGHGVGSRPSLKLREQVADVALDRLLGEVEAVADLAVHESFRDELEDLDLARSRKVLGSGPAGRGGNSIRSATGFRRAATVWKRRECSRYRVRISSR